MPDFFLALDAGTTNIRAMVVDDDGHVSGETSRPLHLNYPQPGKVETDPEAFWEIVSGTLLECLAHSKVKASTIAGLGITGQRTSLMIWEKSSGAPLSPIVSWQDLRGIHRSQTLAEAGYPLIPLSAACKLESVLAEIPAGVERFNKGELAWGNVDTFLAWRLSGGALYATDASQACATGYLDLATCTWNSTLINFQGLNPDSFPSLTDTIGMKGRTDPDIFGGTAIPIGAIVGDQQCAAMAQGCLLPGDGQITFGTSGTCNLNTGTRCMEVQGAYPLVLHKSGDDVVYCLETMVITAGAMLDWLIYGLGLANSLLELEELAGTVDNSGGVKVLPALQGLGSPHADSMRSASLHGLTRSSTKAHVIRATYEGIAYRTREMLGHLYEHAGYDELKVLRVDGGMTQSGIFLQILADTLGLPVDAMTPHNATTYGAALLAGTASGIWTLNDISSLRQSSQVFEPIIPESKRDEDYASWLHAFSL